MLAMRNRSRAKSLFSYSSLIDLGNGRTLDDNELTFRYQINLARGHFPQVLLV